MYMSHFLSDELIFHKNGKEFVSAGFGINSILLNKGLAPLLSFTKDYDHSSSSESGSDSDSDSDSDSSSSSSSNTNTKVGIIKKKVFKSYKNLAIPIGLYLDESKDKHTGEYGEVSEHIKHLPDDIYDELMKLIHYDEKQKRQTRKNKKRGSTKNKSSKNGVKKNKNK